MASVATPKKKTSPVVWVGILAAAAAVYVLTAPSDTPGPSTSTKKRSKTTSKTDGLYTPEDKLAKFASVTTPVADVFNPLVKKPVIPKIQPPTTDEKGGGGGIDARLTGGEANWYYTGLVELDGKRQALLENTQTGETMYVSAGQGWKAARVRTVDVSSVVMVGPDGTAVSIPISQYGVAPGANPATATTVASAAPSTQPLNVPSGITGQIGGGAIRPVPGTATMTLPDGSTVQVPYDPNNPNGNQGGGRRRGGRRNQNQGNTYVP